MTVEHDSRLQIGPLWIEPRVVIYATLIQMTAYAIYDPVDSPVTLNRFTGLLWIAVLPMFALAVAHAFSEVLDLQIRLRRSMGWGDVKFILHSNVQFLYVSLIPIVLLFLCWLVNVNEETAVSFILYLGIVSLAGWGGFGARRSGLKRWQWLLFGAAYACIGAIVVLLEILIRH
jgi:hypothetical protein